jgi:hypothetical protein
LVVLDRYDEAVHVDAIEMVVSGSGRPFRASGRADSYLRRPSALSPLRDPKAIGGLYFFWAEIVAMPIKRKGNVAELPMRTNARGSNIVDWDFGRGAKGRLSVPQSVQRE